MAKSTKTKSRRHPKTTPAKSGKPDKPLPDFPLFAAGNGQWAKKVRGKRHYFGSWNDPQAALSRWLDQRDDLLAGRTPRTKAGDCTVKDAADRFLTGKLHRVQSGELSVDSYRDYVRVLQHVADVFGKNRAVTDLAADDFAALRTSFAKTHGAARLGKDVTVTRMLFRWTYESGLIDAPVRFGPDFKAPSRKSKLKARRAGGRKDFDADELRRLLDAADRPLKAMILLGINCGLGQTDIAGMTHSHVSGEWLNYPRPKTEVGRRAWLWPETLTAIADAAAGRGRHKDPADADCVFITRNGNRWTRNVPHADPGKSTRVDTVAAKFRALMDSLGINGTRSFYGLRHTFETVAGESRDQVAVDLVMGHSDASISSNYRHGISDDRLRDVANVVRSWLFPATME